MKLSLRQRIALALFALTTLGAGALAITFWLGHFWLESRTLDGILERELEIYIEAGTPPQQVDTARTGLRLYRPQREPGLLPPVELRDLVPGSYRDRAASQGVFHVLVRDAAPGDRVWLLYDVREFERREFWLLLALAGSVALIGLLAWSTSGWLSRRLLQPLDSLVQQLRALDWSQRTHRLASPQSDEDTTVIVTALNRLLAEVDELMQRERAFASAASHELRTPLASIRAAAEVLGANVEHPPEPLARIERAVTAASRDLDALLALSRNRQLPVSETLQVDQILQALAEPYVVEAPPGLYVEWQLVPLRIEAPLPVLAIVFTNLLRNAIRAARMRVVVRMKASRVVIEDDGDGVATELLPHVFEPGVKNASGGSGMGLYIAKTLADRMGWKLELQARRNAQGTRASLTFH